MVKHLGKFGIYFLPLLTNAVVGVQIEELENRPIKTLEVEIEDGGLFRVGPDRIGEDDFSYSVRITATDASEINQRWGLTQTLLSSTRLTKFQDGVSSINQRPTREPPILDADISLIPFFDKFAVTDKLKTVGSSDDVAIKDAPAVLTVDEIFLSDQRENGPTSLLQELEVREKFLVTLVQEKPLDTGEIAIVAHQQCVWEYFYRLDSNKVVTESTATACTQTSAPDSAILVGPVATETPTRRYDPDTLGPNNEFRFPVDIES